MATALVEDRTGTTGRRWEVQAGQLVAGGSYRKRQDGREDLRRVPSGKKARTYRVSEMSDKHHEVARLLLLGMDNQEVGKLVGMAPEYISTIRHSPVVKEQLAILRAVRDRECVDVAVQIQEALPKCVEYLTETITGEDISASLKSKNAFGLLSIGGYGASRNVTVNATHAILSAEDIVEIRDRGVRLAEEIGIIEAETEEMVA